LWTHLVLLVYSPNKALNCIVCSEPKSF